MQLLSVGFGMASRLLADCSFGLQCLQFPVGLDCGLTSRLLADCSFDMQWRLFPGAHAARGAWWLVAPGAWLALIVVLMPLVEPTVSLAL